VSALAALAVVQDHDTAADQLRHRRATLPERVELARLEDRAGQVQRATAELGATRAELAGRQRRLEDEVSAIESHRAALER
jgi:hypothetical protein